MHDIDRTELEFSPEMENDEYEQYVYDENEYDEAEYDEAEYGETGVFSEAETMELAAELLDVNSEAELDQFLGGLISRAGQLVKSPVARHVRRRLGGLLKGAAKKALPAIGKAIGSAAGGYVGDRVGGYVGGQLGSAGRTIGSKTGSDLGGQFGGYLGDQAGSAIGRVFGLELEGLSLEDQEFEVAKHFVQFAGAAVKNATSAPPTANPQAVAKQATMLAARQFAPGLIAGTGVTSTGKTCAACGGGGSSGRWYRRGNKIILVGA